MIPRTTAPLNDHSWQWYLRNAYRSAAELLQDLGLPGPASEAFGFPILVPKPFVDRMVPGDPLDPLLLQVLPRQEEGETVPGYSADPLLEQQYRAGAGIIRKYAGRALVIATGTCAVNCRYCFRRHFPYGDSSLNRSDWDVLISEIEAHPDIREIILSGGDPLVIGDEQLSELIGRIEAAGQVTHLRIHSRMPVVLPQRITPELVELLSATRLTTTLVIHANHPQELADDVHDALKTLSAAGVWLLNQSVLLKHVNDDAEILSDLSWRLSAVGVLPYYLHRLDRVAGAAHFDIPASRAITLIDEVRARLPGYLVPRLVEDVPGLASKQIVR